MPTIAPWIVPPNYLEAMQSGAALGLQRSQIGQQGAEAAGRLGLGYAQLGQQGSDNSMQNALAIARLKEEMERGRRLQMYRDASLGLREQGLEQRNDALGLQAQGLSQRLEMADKTHDVKERALGLRASHIDFLEKIRREQMDRSNEMKKMSDIDKKRWDAANRILLQKYDDTVRYDEGAMAQLAPDLEAASSVINELQKRYSQSGSAPVPSESDPLGLFTP